MLKIDRKIFNLIESVDLIIKDAVLKLPSLTNAYENFVSSIQKPVVTIELVLFSPISAENEKSIVKWLSGSDEVTLADGLEFEVAGINFCIRKSDFQRVKSNAIGDIQSTIKCVFLTEEDLNDTDIIEKLIATTSLSDFIYVFVESEYALKKINKEVIEEQKLKIEYINLKNIDPELSFAKKITNADFLYAIIGLYNYVLIQSIESIRDVISLAIDQEKRSLRAKTAMNKQQVMKVQAVKQLSVSDCMSEVKRISSNQSKLFMRGIEEGVDKKIISKNGELITKINEMTENLDTLSEILKNKEVVFSLPTTFSDDVLVQSRQLLLKVGQEQLIMLHDSFKEIQSEINGFFNKEEIPLPTINFKYLTDQKLRSILDEIIHWDKVYEGSAVKKGAYDYFMAVRKYQMFVFLILSTFGLSFSRDLKLYMIPITILLMGIGGLLVYKSVKKESAEKKENELIKAKNAVLTEVKRIGNDFVRSWQKVIRDHIDMQENMNILDIESHLKQFLQGKKKLEEDEKNQVQRQSQALDNVERKFQSFIRLQDDLSKNIERSKTDLKILFTDYIRKVR